MTKENEEIIGAPSTPPADAPTDAPATDAPAPTDAPADTPIDPVKKELEKIETGKKTYTKRERLNFEKKKIDEQLGSLDAEDGIPSEVKDDTPVTVGMLKEREKDESKKTALGLAEAIEDEDERKLTIHYIENRIKPSGDAQADVKLARAAVNSIRNGQIATEMARDKGPNHIPSPAGAPPSHEKQFQPTDQERAFMQPPYNLTKDDIIKARTKTEVAQVA
jgi:hypothetical protein